jgi:AraC family transcriptional regulator
MHVYIKNMVCDRCIIVVRQLLDRLAIKYKDVDLGHVELYEDLGVEQLSGLAEVLMQTGFELLDDKKAKLVEKIKNVIVSLIQGYDEDGANVKLSVLLEQKVGAEYHYLSTLFSSVEGYTIEKYVILQRIEKVKELLIYNEMNVNEIALKLGYSSVQHLSQQFKKVIGLTPSQFKQLGANNRKALDKVAS